MSVNGITSNLPHSMYSNVYKFVTTKWSNNLTFVWFSVEFKKKIKHSIHTFKMVLKD